jgi:hypothetical protein
MQYTGSLNFVEVNGTQELPLAANYAYMGFDAFDFQLMRTYLIMCL